MPDIFNNGALGTWASIGVTVLLFLFSTWDRRSKQDDVLKDMRMYREWYNDGKDATLSKLYFRIEAKLERIVRDPIITVPFVLQMLWVVFIFFVAAMYFNESEPGKACNFLALGIAMLVIFIGNRMLDRFIDAENDAKNLSEWKRREAKHRED